MKRKTKRCTKCKKYFPSSLEYFYKRKTSRDGLDYQCKKCVKEHLSSRKNEIKKITDRHCAKLKSRKGSDISIPKDKECPKCNKIKSSDSFYRHNGRRDGLDAYCIDCKLEYGNDTVRREKQRTKRREWEQKHKKARLQYHKDRENKYPELKVRRSLRSRLREALKCHGVKKESSVLSLVGCSLEELKIHLESQFVKGMVWDNYGKKWSVDHIKPCVAFDLTDLEQQKECFNYKNLQPLWNKDNSTKGSYYNGKRIKK